MANRLATSTSPFVRQGANSPVEWWRWTADAFKEARKRDVPVLVSVGFAAEHWTQLMVAESFNDEETAEFMNTNFVNVLVDRDELPAVDIVLQAAAEVMVEFSGWPLTCFLTPEGQPFQAGTYFPAQSDDPERASFRELLEAMAEGWKDKAAEAREVGGQVVEKLASRTIPLIPQPIDDAVISFAVTTLTRQFDQLNAGFEDEPKFPPTMVLEFLLRHHERTGSADAMTMVRATCEAMSRSGMHDQLAGGFARYAKDALWIVPSFEKTLPDNALLLRLYTHLCRRNSNPRFRDTAFGIAGFLLSDLATTQGGLATALSADADGAEGKTYVWTQAELTKVLGKDDAEWAAELLGVTEEGTFRDGASTLRMIGAADPRWDEAREKLIKARAKRPQPERDDQVVTAWNGLAVAALAEAGVFFEQQEWVDAATKAAELMTEKHLVKGALVRSSLNGKAGRAPGVLADYGCLADGLLALHQATGEESWLKSAIELLDIALETFAVEDRPGSYYDNTPDEMLPARAYDPADVGAPCGGSSLASALLTASALVGPELSAKYRLAAVAAVDGAGQLCAAQALAAGHWLSVVEALRSGPIQVAVIGPEGEARSDLRNAAVAVAPGGSVVVAGAPKGAPLLGDLPLVADAPTAYVGRDYTHENAATTVKELVSRL